MSITVFDVLCVIGGKLVEHWGVPDRPLALIQIGGMRQPGPALAA